MSRSRSSSVEFTSTAPEMEELRSSLQAELLSSWSEVENLQEEKAELTNINLDLSTQLQASKEREAALQEQVKLLHEKFGDTPVEERPPPQRHLSFLSRRRPSLLRSNSSMSLLSKSGGSLGPKSICNSSFSSEDTRMTESTQQQRWNWSQSRRGSLSNTEKDKMAADYRAQIRDAEFEKQAMLAKLQVKMTFSESARESLELARQVQGETLQHLRKQLDMQVAYSKEREVDLENKIIRWKKKVAEKREYISKQHSKMEEYQTYITELTDEIEKFYNVRLSSFQ